MSIKYASADKAKTSLGYIAIISISLLFGSIFLNDFFKLCIHILSKVRRYFRQRRLERQQAKNSERERNNRQVEIEMNQVYAEELEDKLEKFHLALIRAQIKNRKQIMKK